MSAADDRMRAALVETLGPFAQDVDGAVDALLARFPGRADLAFGVLEGAILAMGVTGHGSGWYEHYVLQTPWQPSEGPTAGAAVAEHTHEVTDAERAEGIAAVKHGLNATVLRVHCYTSGGVRIGNRGVIPFDADEVEVILDDTQPTARVVVRAGVDQ